MWYLAILITIRFDSFGVEPIPAKFFRVQEKFDVIANMHTVWKCADSSVVAILIICYRENTRQVTLISSDRENSKRILRSQIFSRKLLEWITSASYSTASHNEYEKRIAQLRKELDSLNQTSITGEEINCIESVKVKK